MIGMPGLGRALLPRHFTHRRQLEQVCRGNLFMIPSQGDPVDLSSKYGRHAILS
jgi:hypothetical protein